MVEQVGDGRRQKMIGLHQAARRGDDAVAVGVGVVADREVETVAQADQPRHGVRRRTIHPDLSVPIGGHEAECRVDFVLDDLSVEVVPADDLGPIMHARAAQRVNAERQPRVADCLHVDHAGEVAYVMAHIIVAANAGRKPRALIRDAPHVLNSGFEQAVGTRLDPSGDGRIRRTARRRVVLEAAIFRRIVRRREDNAVGKPLRAAAVVGEDGVRDDGRRGVAVVGVDHRHNVVRDEHLQRGDEGRLGKGVGVDAEKSGPSIP